MRGNMAKEIKEHLKIALQEIGEIKPWFDKKINEWVFSHPLYPVEYGGETQEEVIKNYPKYLQEFLKQRLNDNLDSLVEKKTSGRGGKREGAGRPKGTIKEPTKRISLPVDVATWIVHPAALQKVRNLMHKNHL